ncbi:PREDICTED: gasdermin-B [Condylura cristata]|uniref:gasdermin-B n=1 Tax=Condylura cristata TaxID=143302 RepID=UPI000643DD65|nr:PREDICTED: gasdermin-B [Condylura cristata]
MGSVFEKVTEVVVKEMDAGGSMVAVRSIASSDKYRCLSLVKRKNSGFGCHYCDTGLTLMDILERQEGDDVDSSAQGPLAGILHCQKKVNMIVSGVCCEKITIRGNYKNSQKQEISIMRDRTPQEYLNSLENRKLKENLPPKFRKIRRMKEDLYLVTETLKNEKQETLTDSWAYKFWGMFDFLPLGLGVNYKTKVGLDIYDSDQTTSFPKSEALHSEDTRNLKEKVEDMEESLMDLTEAEKQDVLKCLTNCLRDDQSCRSYSREEEEEEEAAVTLILCLFNDAGILIEKRAEAILTVLDALMGLSEELQLLDDTLQKGTLPQLKEQVESLLERYEGEQPPDVEADSETSRLCALYVAAAIMVQLSASSASS